MLLRDWWLIGAIVLAPMTGLRIDKVGPGEVLAVVWCVLSLVGKGRKSIHVPTVLFWVFFLASMIVGTVIGLSIAPQQVTLEGLVVWLFFGVVAILGIAVLSERPVHELETILSRTGVFAVVFYAGLWAYGTFVSPSILGAPIWYGPRFSGGGTNPHQVAILLSFVLFINLRSSLSARSAIIRFVYLLAAVGAIFLGLATQASSWILAAAVSLVFFTIVMVVRYMHSAQGRVAMITLLAAAGTILVVLQSQKLLALISDFIASDENGQGRIDIWQSFGQVFEASPAFGLGPGAHANGGTIEFHNTYLEIVAATGLVGALAFVFYHLSVVRATLRWDPILASVILPLFVYGVAGFAARRLTYWLVLVLVLAVAMSGLSKRRETSKALQIVADRPI